MRRVGLVPVLLVAAVLPACRDDSADSTPSAEDTEALCDALKTMREESLTDLRDGDPLDPDEFNASVEDFYLSLREYVPPSIQDDIELVAEHPGDDLRDVSGEVRDAAVRVGNYFYEQCGDELAPE